MQRFYSLRETYLKIIGYYLYLFKPLHCLNKFSRLYPGKSFHLCFANLISMPSRSFHRGYSGIISSFFFFAYHISRFTVFHVSHFAVGSPFLLCDIHRQRRRKFKERRLQNEHTMLSLPPWLTTRASAIRYRSTVAIYMLSTIVIFYNMWSEE